MICDNGISVSEARMKLLENTHPKSQVKQVGEHVKLKLIKCLSCSDVHKCPFLQK